MSFCPSCGRELTEVDARFCVGCGTPLASASEETSWAQSPQVEDVVHESTVVSPESSKRSLWIGIGAAGLVLALVALAAWGALAAVQRQKEAAAAAAAESALARVPDVLGLTATQASEKIKGAGLLAGQVSYEPGAQGALGAVVSATPAPGERVKRNSLVALTVVGAQPVTVPNFVGLSAGGAQAAAAAVGLNVISAEKKSKTKKGTVLAQDPAPGTPVQPGGSVHVVVSKGASSKSSAASSDGVYTPKKGSAERTAIMDACRIYLSYDGLFVVDTLKVRGSRAFANVTPEDNKSWGSIGMYLMKSGGGWVVSTDSRTAASQGNFVAEDDWLFNR